VHPLSKFVRLRGPSDTNFERRGAPENLGFAGAAFRFEVPISEGCGEYRRNFKSAAPAVSISFDNNKLAYDFFMSLATKS
jgi:hypothetical protein